jgi:RNA polymerase sigma factor (sigma-70 family)
MSKLRDKQQEVKDLVAKVVEGDGDSFRQLEGLAKPLMVSHSEYFSSLHYKFEFDDFYSICLNALYEACIKYDPKNPSFFSYAKSFMKRQCCRELEYWNAEMRDIFEQEEISCDRQVYDLDKDMESSLQLRDERETLEIAEEREFTRHITEIISSSFEGEKALVMYLYIIKDMSPKNISIQTGLHYQNTYAIIRRGITKIKDEYRARYLPLTN